MSDHADAQGPTGISDLYVFQQPKDSSKTIFILGVDPFAPTPTEAFEPEASYQFKIDTDGDAQADIAYHVQFASSGDGSQVATVYKLTGAAARDMRANGDGVLRNAPVSDGGKVQVTTDGAYRFYAGLRSDPFFLDAMGLRNKMQFTGDDFFADKNVLGIVLEVPNTDLGLKSQIGVWARTIAPVQGKLSIVDQAGRPGISVMFNRTAEDLHQFNETEPSQQREAFLAHFAAGFEGLGYSQVEATQLAGGLLPDILAYDYARSAGFPNGRKLTDDVVDSQLPLLTLGKITTDKVGPHTDYLSELPYLGPPH